MLPPAPPALMVHTIDYFRSFISDPYLFGQIAANHALSGKHVARLSGPPSSFADSLRVSLFLAFTLFIFLLTSLICDVDVHAMNGDPTSALALCVLPYGPEEKVMWHSWNTMFGIRCSFEYLPFSVRSLSESRSG